jgi:hypothetical protein
MNPFFCCPARLLYVSRRHVPQLSHFVQHDTNVFIPWDSDKKRRLHEKVIWDLFVPWKVYGWLRDMGYKV